MNIKEKLKKTANKNMAILLIIAAVLFVLTAICFVSWLCDEATLKEMKNNIKHDYAYTEDGAEDVAGYGFIIESLAYGLGSFGNRFVMVFGIGIPAVVSLVITVFSVISRIVYSSESGKRLTAYRIIMGFLLFVMSLFFLLYSIPFYTLGILIAIPAVIIDILIIVTLFILIRNTYSKRILN